MDLSQEDITRLAADDPHFRMLYEQHRIYEKQLKNFDNSTYLSSDDEFERKKIQKLKLAGKDEMNMIVSQARVQ
ncbi:MAG: DUF465 domain-containing protein [Desulfuromonadaceae bacterium]|nr:DUF465 domain-containing protein [Desulfuromonadaceae bacterium]